MSYSALEDVELVQLLKSDEGAFAEIYNRYWKLLYLTAFNITRNQEVAQDAVQEVFTSLWQRKQEIEIQKLKAYLQQSIRFQVLKAIREQKVDERFYRHLADVSADMVYEHPLLFKEHETFLQLVFNSLPEDCLQVFKLSREEHLTYKQIAGQLNISEKTVEKKISICLKQIRMVLRENLGLALPLLIGCYQNS